MKFSISTSFYNRGHLVDTLYEQIKAQTHTDWEWVVTDDFSEHNNAEERLKQICNEDSRVKYYQQSRKKECFYNPQRGCTGDIIIQFDSDDYSYPKILEIYNHFFLKHPDVMGISCDNLALFTDGDFKTGLKLDLATFEKSLKFGFIPMGRAWRNIIDEFDDGSLEWFQNDTNIVRTIENKGKWLYLPRVLYDYIVSDDGFSRGVNDEYLESIENERLFIENKFPHLDNPDKVTYSLYYHLILDKVVDFAHGYFNKSISRKKLLYINNNLKPYERQLLKELFFDHDLYFDYNLNIKFDEIFFSLEDFQLDEIKSIHTILRDTNSHTPLKLSKIHGNDFNMDVLISSLEKEFGGVGWWSQGFRYRMYFSTAI
jgi:glycosyltransferase involved in cell wall biosynthesis